MEGEEEEKGEESRRQNLVICRPALTWAFGVQNITKYQLLADIADS